MMLTLLGKARSFSMNSGKVSQSQVSAARCCSTGICSVVDNIVIVRSRSAGRTGARLKPQLALSTEVTPCGPESRQYGLQKIAAS